MATTTTVITGATSGIGEATAIALAKQDHALYLLVRDTQKGEALKQKLIAETGNKHIYVIKCDLADLASVAQAADELSGKLFNINVLINNAGGMFSNFTTSKDGFEMTFALNHLGHFLLTERLMPLLKRGHGRIINVSSDMHQAGKPRFGNVKGAVGYSAVKAYGDSKLFNIYFTKSLAERYADAGITAYALHPRVVKTQFNAKLNGFLKFFFSLSAPFAITAEKGAETSVFLATAPKPEINNGSYYIKKKAKATAPIVNNEDARDKLWALSEEFVAPFTL